MTVGPNAGDLDFDWPDVAVFPADPELLEPHANLVVTVWEGWASDTATRQVYLRLGHGCDAGLVTDSDAAQLLTPNVAPYSNRWPRVTVTVDGAGSPAVVVLYNRTMNGQFGELWAQVLLPQDETACLGSPPALERCFCTGSACLGAYWPNGTPILPEKLAPVAIDDDRDGTWTPVDRPDCSDSAGCGLCSGGTPAAVGSAFECDYAPVSADDFDIVAVPPGNGAPPRHLVAVAWSQGAGRDHGRWSFFDVFGFAPDETTPVPLSAEYLEPGTPPIPAVRLESTPDVTADDSESYTQEGSPAIAYAPGTIDESGRRDALVLAFHEFRPGEPGESRLPVAVYDLAGLTAGPPWLPTALSDVATLGQQTPPGEPTFDCTASGWSPHPALAATGEITSTDGLALIVLAFDAEALTCALALPDGQGEDVYAILLGYGATGALELFPAWDRAVNSGDELFADFGWDGSARDNPLILLNQSHPFAAAREDGLVIGWTHLGYRPFSPGAETVQMLFQQQIYAGPGGPGPGFYGPLPSDAPQDRQRHGAVAMLPAGALAPPGNWEAQFAAVWSTTTTPWTDQDAEIDAALISGNNVTDIGCDIIAYGCQAYLEPQQLECAGDIDLGCGVTVDCRFRCDWGEHCNFATGLCDCYGPVCGGTCCDPHQVCDGQGACCIPQPPPELECDTYTDATCGSVEYRECKDPDKTCVTLGQPCVCENPNSCYDAQHQLLDCCGPGQDCSTGSCACPPDGDPCTVDAPDWQGVCHYYPKDCRDQDACTFDTCDAQSGECAHPPFEPALDCDDGDPCTRDECDPTRGCINAPLCDDGVACTVDACSPLHAGGSTCSHEASDAYCDDRDPSTLNVCDPGFGCRTMSVSHYIAPLALTVQCGEEACVDNVSVCVSDPLNGDHWCRLARPEGLECDDYDDEACGVHVFYSACNDVDESCDIATETCACDTEVCDGDCCPEGAYCDLVTLECRCRPDADVCVLSDSSMSQQHAECDDRNDCTLDSYLPILDRCNHIEHHIGSSCDDGLECTLNDTCGYPMRPAPQILGCGGVPSDSVCDDSNACTDDSCDSATGCLNADNTAPCDDGDECTEVDTCSVGRCVGVELPTEEKFRLPLPAPPPLKPPSLTGHLPGRFWVSEKGSAQYEIPLEAPPGRAGMQPRLSLMYSSAAGDGSLGIGWSLTGLSTIHRCSSGLAVDGRVRGVRYDAEDPLCLDGSHLVAVKGEYGAAETEYRLESDVNLQIIAETAQRFVVHHPDGHTYIYGAQYDCHDLDGSPCSGVIWGRGGQVRVWALAEVRDASQNYMRVTYFRQPTPSESLETLEFLPSTIRYTGNYATNAAPARHVTFHYKPAREKKAAFVSGQIVQRNSLLQAVSFWAPGLMGDELVREYFLLHESDFAPSPSRLLRVTMCVDDGTCIPATTFEWQEDPVELVGTTMQAPLEEASYAPSRVLLLDTDNSGVPELVLSANIGGDGLVRREAWGVYKRQGYQYTDLLDGFITNTARFQYIEDFDPLPMARGMSLDGDAREDLFVQGGNYIYLNDYAEWQYNSVSSLQGHVAVTLDPSRPRLVDYVQNDGMRSVDITDLNGDRKDDLWTCRHERVEPCVVHSTWNTSYGEEESQYLCDHHVPHWYLYFNNGSEFFVSTMGNGLDSPDHYWLDRPSELLCEDDVHFVGDFTGDGAQDVLVGQAAWGPHMRLLTLPMTYTASEVRIIETDLPVAIVDDEEVRVGDFNGDGLADLVSSAESQRVTLLLSRGDGTFQLDADVLPDDASPGSFHETLKRSQVVDYDADGQQDLVCTCSNGDCEGHPDLHPWLLMRGGFDGFDVRELPPLLSGEPYDEEPYGPDETSTSAKLWADLNGDGAVDMLWVRRDGSLVAYERQSPRAYASGALIYKIREGDVGVDPGDPLWPDSYTYQIDYAPASDSSVYSRDLYKGPASALRRAAHECTYPAVCGLPPGPPVKRHWEDGGARRFMYTYHDSRWNAWGRGWLGFTEVTTVDEYTGTVRVTGFDNESIHAPDAPVSFPWNPEKDLFYVAYPYAGRPAWSATITRLLGEEAAWEPNWDVRVERFQYGFDGFARRYRPYLKGIQRVHYVDYDVDTDRLERGGSGLVISSAETVFGDFDEFRYPGNVATYYGGYDISGDEWTRTGVPRVVHTAEYVQNAGSQWILGRLDRLTTTRATAPAVRDSSPTAVTTILDFDYGGPANQLLRVVRDPDNGPTKLTTDYSYGADGQLETVVLTDGAGVGRSMRLEYEAGERIFLSAISNGLPSEVSNGLGHRRDLAYHPGLGVLQLAQDAGGHLTTYEYDAFGRVVGRHLRAHEYDALGRVVGWSPPGGNLQSYSYDSVQQGTRRVSVVTASGRGGIDEVQLHFGWDGALEKVQEKAPFGRRTEVDYLSYGGRLLAVSLPHFDDDQNEKWITYDYDELDRISEVSFFGSSVAAYDYDAGWGSLHPPDAQEFPGYDLGSSVIVTDAGGNSTRVVYDGLGRVEELDNAVRQLVDLRYGTSFVEMLDPLGNATLTVTDADAGTMYVDSPGFGRQSARVNAFGDLVVMQTNAGEEVTFEYDAAGRPTVRVDPEGTTIWTYDAFCGIAEPGALLRWRRSDTAGNVVNEERYGYDGYGRVEFSEEVIAGRRYRIDLEYDDHGRIERIVRKSVDDGEVFAYRYEYGPGGLVTAVTDDDGSVLWALQDIDGSLRPTQEQLGDLLVRTKAYDARTGALDSAALSFVGGVEPFAEDLYSYDERGMLTERQFRVVDDTGVDKGFQERFEHDAIGRVTRSTRWRPDLGFESGRTLNYGYDLAGNLFCKDATIFDYGGWARVCEGGIELTYSDVVHPHRVMSTDDGRQFHYDANGNQDRVEWDSGSWRSGQFSWFGLPRKFETSAGERVGYLYGVEDRRVRKAVTGGESVDYVGPGYERVEDGSGVRHVYLLDPGIEVVRSGSGQRLRWDHADHLGSPFMRLMGSGAGAGVTVEGTVSDLVSYDVFGDCVGFGDEGQSADCAGLEPWGGYTGHELDNDFSMGLVNMGGRLYDPSVGRMLSPDPVMSLESALNPYSYARNSPLMRVDPSGYEDGIPWLVHTEDESQWTGPGGQTMHSYWLGGGQVVGRGSLPFPGEASTGHGRLRIHPGGPSFFLDASIDVVRADWLNPCEYGYRTRTCGIGEHQTIQDLATGEMVTLDSAGASGFLEDKALAELQTQEDVDRFLERGRVGDWNRVATLKKPLEVARDLTEGEIGPVSGAMAGLASLFRVGGSAGGVAFQAEGRLLGPRTVRTADFASDSLLDSHFVKHAAEWGAGNITRTGYLKRARRLLSSEPGDGIFGHVRANGDILRYNWVTNEFGVGTPDGVIRTMFRPEDGLLYWLREVLKP